jgi:hypothetical protein
MTITTQAWNKGKTLTKAIYVLCHEQGPDYAVYRNNRPVFHGTRAQCADYCIRNGINYRIIR